MRNYNCNALYAFWDFMILASAIGDLVMRATVIVGCSKEYTCDTL